MRISKLEVAKQQLEVACDLFLNGKSVFAVHTLSGAAEDILGNLALRAGQTNMFQRMHRSGEEITGRAMTVGEISELINGTRNALKHAKDPAEDTFTYNSTHGLVMLFRAMVNFQLVTGGLTTLMEQAWQELKRSHPLFLPPHERPVD